MLSINNSLNICSPKPKIWVIRLKKINRKNDESEVMSSMWYLFQTSEIEQVTELISFYSGWPLPDVDEVNNVLSYFDEWTEDISGKLNFDPEVKWYIWNSYADMNSIDHDDANTTICKLKGLLPNVYQMHSGSMSPWPIVAFDEYDLTKEDLNNQKLFLKKVAEIKALKRKCLNYQSCLNTIYNSKLGWLVRMIVQPPQI